MIRNTFTSIALILSIIIIINLFDTTISFAATKQEKHYERVIAHGGGGYEGYETTNSVQAINNSIKNGYKIIELDMDFSSDDKIIMLHDWDKTIDYYIGTSFERKITESQLLNLSIHGKLEVMTFDKLTKILDETTAVIYDVLTTYRIFCLLFVSLLISLIIPLFMPKLLTVCPIIKILLITDKIPIP